MTDSEFLSREFVESIIDTKKPETKIQVMLDWIQFTLFKDEMKQIEFMQSKVPVYI